MTAAEMQEWARRDAAIRAVALTPRCDLGMRYFDIQQATGVEDARWQPFQTWVLNQNTTFLSLNKSRQIGASFTLSGDSLFEGMGRYRHTYIYVSFNLEEAKEKIIYAKQWWESRHPHPETVPAAGEFDDYGNWRGTSPHRVLAWPELVKDSILELQWSNGLRLISHPCRPPRGKKASVILDELAHYQNAGVIYTAALPMITRGRGQNKIWVASTPLGASDKFWEIHCNAAVYPDYVRADFGWWEIDDLCAYRSEALAAWKSGMDAEEMVRRFGSHQLKLLYRNSLREDFLQEYCLQFLDAVHAFLPWELIKSCYPSYWENQEEAVDEEDFENSLANSYRDSYVGFVGRTVDEGIEIAQKLERAYENGRMGDTFILSYDCGRDRDKAEINIWELSNGHFYQRALISLSQVRFAGQRMVLKELWEKLPIVRGWMDKGGIGRQIAEEVEAWGGEIRGITFTNERKEAWAVTMKKCMEMRMVTLIPDREQEQQFHSIQRKITSSKNMLYEIQDSHATIGGGQKIKHHADKFWAAAMGVYLCKSLVTGYDIVEVAEERVTPVAKEHIATKGFGFPREAPKAGVVAQARNASAFVSSKLRAR